MLKKTRSLMTFPPGLRALNHPEYRRLYLTQLISQTGGWIQAVAQSWLVLQPPARR